MPRTARHNCIFFSDNTAQVMGSSVTKNLIGILLLIVLAFAIGITAADSKKTAAIIIFAAAGLIGIVAMGKNVWMSLFVLIPIAQSFSLLPIPTYLLLVIPVFLYWCVLVLLGHAKFTWRKLPGADFLLFVFLLYMVSVIYRHPALDHVTCRLLGIQMQNITIHYEYHLCLFVLIFYITLSCIPMECKKLKKLIKWGIIIRVILLPFNCIYAAASSGTSVFTTSESVRFDAFAPLGLTLAILIYANSPFIRILTSPKNLFGLAISFFLIILTGYRNVIARFCYIMLFIALIKKEHMWVIAATLMGIASLVVINDRNTIDKLPYTAQRILTVVPWMDVNPSVLRETTHSESFRQVMWDWALDPRTGRIKDYIWGDGCVKNADLEARYKRATATITVDDAEEHVRGVLILSNEWHNGFIAVLKELGIVGVIMAIIINIYAFIITCRISLALRNTSMLKYFLAYTYELLYAYIVFFILPYSTRTILMHFVKLAIAKVFYWIAVEEGKINHKTQARKYVPALIQQNQSIPSGRSFSVSGPW